MLSDTGRIARDVLLADQQSLRAFEFQSSLDCVHGSLREQPDGLFYTDVHSSHVDTATGAADTYLCTYVGGTFEGLPNHEAQRRVDNPETHAELLRLYGGEDDAGFLEYLAENFYDLHYALLAAESSLCVWTYSCNRSPGAFACGWECCNMPEQDGSGLRTIGRQVAPTPDKL